MVEVACEVDECDRPIRARGWCGMHYSRWRRRGATDALRTHFTDPEESFAAQTARRGDCLIWTGAKDSGGYGQIWVSGKFILAHRHSWERVNGAIPDGMMVDHRDHCDKLCVEPSHLRLATRAQNGWNRAGAVRGSKTGVRNVYPSGERFRVEIAKGGKVYRFGSYLTLGEAAKIASAKRAELFGEYAGRGTND